MGLQHSIEGNARIVRLTYSGDVSFDEWAAAMKAIFADPEYEPGFRFLLDRRLALTPDVGYVKRAVEFTRQHQRQVAGSRWAIVVSNSATFGRVLLGRELGKHLVKDSSIFRDMAEAEHWLRSG